VLNHSSRTPPLITYNTIAGILNAGRSLAAQNNGNANQSTALVLRRDIDGWLFQVLDNFIQILLIVNFAKECCFPASVSLWADFARSCNQFDCW